MAKRRRSNQGAAMNLVQRVLRNARRVAVHALEHGKPGPVAVPGVKLYRLRIALEAAGVDMGKARRASAGAVKAQKTIKAKKGNG